MCIVDTASLSTSAEATRREHLAHVLEAIEWALRHDGARTRMQHTRRNAVQRRQVDEVDARAHLLDGNLFVVHKHLTAKVLDLDEPALERHHEAALELVFGARELCLRDAATVVR